jgi:hypothetical protein
MVLCKEPSNELRAAIQEKDLREVGFMVLVAEPVGSHSRVNSNNSITFSLAECMIPIIKLALLGLAAIALGALLAMPMLYSNTKPPSLNTVGVEGTINCDIIYAYFSTAPPSGNESVLWNTINVSSETESTTVFYYFILNVTDNSNVTVAIDHLEVDAAKFINMTDLHPTGFISEILYPFLKHTIEIASNPEYDTDTSNVWNPDQSRLIAFSGFNQISDINTNLQNGTFYLGSEVYGTPLGNSLQSMVSGSSKQVQLEIRGDQYIYSELAKNQTISISPYQGLEVHLNRGS